MLGSPYGLLKGSCTGDNSGGRPWGVEFDGLDLSMTFLDSLESVLWVEEARGRDGCSGRWLSWLSLSNFRSSRCSVSGLLNVS
jgi:hypothetical protein